MNNIEILEELIENYKHAYPEDESWCAIYPLQMKAIENLIKENKELKEKYEFVINNNLDDKYEEVLEKTFKKYIDKDFISKSKIKEKIEELIKEADYRSVDNPTGRIHFHKEPCDYQISVLQELLEKGE